MRFLSILLLTISLVVVPGIEATAQQVQTARPENRRVRVTILHLSNVFQAMPVDRGASGGLARVATLLKQIRSSSPNTLLLFGGNTIAPSVESITYRGEQMIAAWNAVGLDYAVYGNHDFDYGPAVLNDRVKQANFKWISSNVLESKGGPPFANVAPYAVRTLGGVNIGIIGLTWPETKTTSRPGPDTFFVAPCEAARDTTAKLKAAGVQFIIALAHLPIADNKALVACAPGIDLVLGGSEYVRLESLVNGRPIFAVESDAREIGRVDVYFDLKNPNGFESMEWSTIPVTQDAAEDREVADVVKRFTDATLADAIGQTAVSLDATDNNRTRETNLGSFITDSIRNATGADVAILNGGSIRADRYLLAGEITRRDLLSILPFKNSVATVRVTGAALKAALENSVSRPDEEKAGRFLQVSGLRFIFDGRRPPGSRVLSVSIKDKPLDESASYTLATITYLLQGGDEYSMFAKLPPVSTSNLTDTEILLKAINNAGTIKARTDGRIVRLDQSFPR